MHQKKEVQKERAEEASKKKAAERMQAHRTY